MGWCASDSPGGRKRARKVVPRGCSGCTSPTAQSVDSTLLARVVHGHRCSRCLSAPTGTQACDCEHSGMPRARQDRLSPPASSAAWGTCFGGVWSRRRDGAQRTSQALLGGRRYLGGPLAYRHTATYVAHAWICREAPHDPSIACGMCWRAGDCSSRSVKMASKSPPPHLHHQSS